MRWKYLRSDEHGHTYECPDCGFGIFTRLRDDLPKECPKCFKEFKQDHDMVTVGRIYRHFKGNLYRVIAIANHTETGERLVVYKNVSDAFWVYARPYNLFVSKVDKIQYPDATQEYRFERVD